MRLDSRRPHWAANAFLPLAILFALAVAWMPTAAAQADPFAGLTVVPFGEQTFDIATGRTTLSEGGEVIDRVTGVVLTAPFIVLQEGVFIEAQEVEVTGVFGTFQASNLLVDLESSVVRAEGNLRITIEATTVHGELLEYFATPGVLRMSGGVVGDNPGFEATSIIVDFSQGTALLVGPYVFEDGPFILRSNLEGSLLELTSVDLDGVPTFDAATEVNPESLARLELYLP